MRHGPGRDWSGWRTSWRNETPGRIRWRSSGSTSPSSGSDRSWISLLEPDLFARERLQQLTCAFPLPTLGVPDLLLEMARDDAARWRPWIKACALHAASTVAPEHLDGLTQAAESLHTPIGPEAEVVHETIADLRARPLDRV